MQGLSISALVELCPRCIPVFPQVSDPQMFDSQVFHKDHLSGKIFILVLPFCTSVLFTSSSVGEVPLWLHPVEIVSFVFSTYALPDHLLISLMISLSFMLVGPPQENIFPPQMGGRAEAIGEFKGVL